MDLINGHHPLDFPALDGRTVTEGHAQTCRDQGHATHTVNGQDTGVCPRCGDLTNNLHGRPVQEDAEWYDNLRDQVPTDLDHSPVDA